MNSILRYLSRYETLKFAYAGLLKTGESLICFKNEQLLLCADLSRNDDLGIFYFIPLLARFCAVSLECAIDYFFYGMIIVSVLSFLIGFYLLFRSFLLLLYAAASFCLLYREGFFVFKDVYIANFATVFMTLPIFLWFYKRETFDTYYKTFLFLVGILLGYFEFIRSYSSLPPLLFIVICLSFEKSDLRKKTWLLGILLLGCVISTVHMSSIIERACKVMEKHTGQPSKMTRNHTIWPSFYAGFGYLENHLGIRFDDGCVAQKVEELAPGTENHSAEFCRVIKKEVLRILWQERYTAWSTLFAKFGVALFLFLVCMNVGCFASLYLFSWREQAPFLVGCLISAVPGIITEPRPIYMTGLTAFAFLYGVYSIGWLLQKHKYNKN